jgi:signal transduction histidine kinase
MPRLYKDKYFWIVVALLIFLAILYYAPDVPALNWLSTQTHLGITRRAFERALFLIPIILAAWRFGFKNGLACAIISGAIMIPRVIISPFRPDAIAETIVIVGTGIVISLLISKLEEARVLQQFIADELAEANLRLQEMDRLKSVFLASMSHELRTPLNSIIGFTGIMLLGMSGKLNEEQKRQLTMIKNSSDHLLSLINDVLDISKVEAGKIEILAEEFSLHDVAKEVVQYLSPTADEKGVEIINEVPEEITVFSDKRRVKQVLLNLMSNAVKFTEQGSVIIEATVLRGKKLEIRVVDTGRGIRREDMNKLFQPFQRIDMSYKKSYTEGTGLGLYLTRGLSHLLGGSIRARSTFGKGSEFIFTMPLHMKEAAGNENSTRD